MGFSETTISSIIDVASARLFLAPEPRSHSWTAGSAQAAVALATLTEAGSDHTAGDYTALIDWGDHSGSVGTVVVAPDGFVVQGSHTYLNPGAYAVRVLVQANGQSASVTDEFAVAPAPIVLNGGLDPASDTGSSSSDGITRDNTPTFRGVTAPDTPLLIVATAAGGSTPLLVGRTQSDSAGDWSLTTVPLPDGDYAFVAVAENAAGYILKQAALAAGAIVIDTAAPTVSVASFDPKAGRVVLTIQGDIAGLDLTNAFQRSNYSLTGTVPHPKKPYTRPKVSAVSASGGQATLTLTFNNGHALATGSYRLNVVAGTVRDLAGNSASAGPLSLPAAASKRASIRAKR